MNLKTKNIIFPSIIISSVAMMIIGEPFDEVKGLNTYTHNAMHNFTFPVVPIPHTHEEHQTESIRGCIDVTVAPTGWNLHDSEMHKFLNLRSLSGLDLIDLPF